MGERFPAFTDRDILSARPAKQPVRPDHPYAFLAEPELSPDGRLTQVATVFLTNRECPFRCLMCDLWRHTTDLTVPPGAIPAQIDHALRRLPEVGSIKLYNSGNFFDRRAIPPSDWEAVAERLVPFDRVIVENHPRLCTPKILPFAAMVPGRFEIALGLETTHPDVLRALNKRMTVDDFVRAAHFLVDHGMDVRTFLLLGPPFLPEDEALDWTRRSIAFAFESGSGCVSLIPLRTGYGLLGAAGERFPVFVPRLRDVETVMEAGLGLGEGRLFVDLWDTDHLPACPTCRPARLARLREMNHTQRPAPAVTCARCEG